MEDIKVVEYVRVTNFENKTVIGKVTEVYENSYIVDTQQEETSGEYGKCCEFKHSLNIIDLIEVNDIVKYKLKGMNSVHISEVKGYIDARKKEKTLMVDGYKLEQVKLLKILTHEMFENISFEV